jgi:signal transduction histidine kinase/ligand-binding sensor domain-containing protein/DNA-binding response OmpR family regulator
MMSKTLLTGKTLFFLLFLCCRCFVALAQHDLNFTALTTKDGLSSNTVSVIWKDHTGLMWIGTSDGLNKFDGTNFTIYRHNAQDSTSIPANEILSICEDHLGRMWVGTGGGGLAYYDRRHNSFVSRHANADWPNLRDISARAICEDHMNNLWVGSYGTLRKIDFRTNKILKVPLGKLPDSFVVLSLFEDSKQRMWVGTNNGVYLFDLKSGKSSLMSHSDVAPASISDNVVKSITEDLKGNMWFGTTKGLNLLMPDGKSFRNFRHADNNPQSLSCDDIYVIEPAGDNKLWLGTEEGLNIFDLCSFKSFKIGPDIRKIFSLTNKSVKSIYIDKSGIFWLGTYQGGINKYDRNLPLFNLKRSNALDPRGLASPLVTSFAEYKTDQVFVGTDGGSVNLFDQKTGLFTHYGQGSPLGHLSVLALKLDTRGSLWVGAFHKGLFQLNPITGQFKKISTGAGDSDINNKDIRCIEEDSRGRIWVGTLGSGINVYNPETGTFIKYTKNARRKGEMLLPLNGYISTISESKDGEIWVGSLGTGIAVFNPGLGKFRVYNRGNSSLANDGVLCTFHDSAGNTWVGTNGGGLSLFNRKNGKFITYAEREGLSSGIVHKILQDENGVLWLSTDQGICCFDPVSKKIKNFTTHNGVQNSPFISGSGMQSTRGELFFGGQDGFNYFDPKLLPNNHAIPKILLTELKVSNNTVYPSEGSPLKENISIAKDIRLAYGQNFAISYVALNYTTPQQNKYSYKLIDFDKEWNFVGTSRIAYYTNIDPGNYTFQVRASNNDGTWNDQVTTIHIEVRPPLWRTAYAYIAYVLIVLFLLFYIRHRGIQKIRMQFALEQEKAKAKQLIEQERSEAEKLRELDLLKIKFLTNLSHEFRTPISLILAPADKLLSAPIDPAISGQVNVMRRNARRLLNLVNQLLDFRKMEEQELKLNLVPGDIIAFIKEAADSFRDLSERKKIDFRLNAESEHLLVAFDHNKIERIIFNLLSNAFKFTKEGGTVSLNVACDDSSVAGEKCLFRLEFIDNGTGILAEVQEKIFERFYQCENAVSILNQGSGIGLSITREFVELHGGTIAVTSTPGRGSIFTINLPLTPLPVQDEPKMPDNDDFPEENAVSGIDVSEQEVPGVSVQLPTVLLVEDNDEMRYYLKDNLKALYQVVEAANGKEGWQKALSCHPQLIVSDISMPEMNGIELSKKIKADKRTAHIPVILLTAITGEEEQLKGLKTGANDYLTKPFNFEILNAKIKNLLMLNRTLKDTYSKQIHVQGNDIEIESGDAKLLNNIVRYIEDKLNDPELSVEELSRHVGMSRGSLYTKLLELTGLTPLEYIRSVKLDKAVILLEKSDYNVAQIAYMTGFGTPSWFSNKFKAKYNMLPSEYQNSKRKEKDRQLTQETA